MRCSVWWWALAGLLARAPALPATPTACEEDACRCDPFTRLICTCTTEYSEVTLRPDGAYRVPSTATAIIIDNCSRVTFLPDTVRNLIQLRNIQLRNVDHVVINERALSWSPFSNRNEMNPGLRISITNSTIDEIASHAIQGRVNDVVISDSRIRALKPFAFSSLTGVNNIDLSDNVFENIEIQAFKKFTVDNFILRGGRIDTLPSRFLSDVEVTNLFRMEGVTVNYLFSLTFLVNSPKRVLIESNNIETLEGDGFHIVTRGPITFRNNTVTNLRKGAFFGFTVDLEIASVMGPQELLIDNNTVSNLGPDSLVFNRTRLTLRVDGLRLNASCSCAMAEPWRAVLAEQGGALACWYPLEGHFVSLPTYFDTRCGPFKQNFWIFVLIGVIIVLVLAAIAIFFIVRRENEKKKKVQIVMPDGKTYRETEFHIVVERAELLTTDL
ncbi:uncharacterized protein LOC110372449 [Helicoverpa armigera]|uniref:uncharacterized protein LOC110372449 n=1 Tax=Helicoverpa armigera TaxID=29058 RepID=UPI000B3A2CF3|nr:uncharacterized protein LOC110372449 [Helicoverpa armigera]XP_021184853.1 uncharacterized protein LOC110372449 [Helicoverpa armigera]XP_021184855.1 uncharacterized protein LOC110372449 [Helicoverpa armigera]XP_021184856.1 uncharacterized protein LOC110372449 [Helicoverpa armigera]